MTKQRLDIELAQRKLTASRSQSESWIKLGKVTVDGFIVTKPSRFVDAKADIRVTADTQYVSRAGLKLESVAKVLELDFKDKTVLDVGSSTGGFTDYALRNGAKKVYAVDVGTDQLHPSLRHNKLVEVHEKTDIRDFDLDIKPEIIVIDVSFISLRDILPNIHDKLCDAQTQIVAMVKPQFETHKTNPSTSSGLRNSRQGDSMLSKGIIKNDAMRRQILHDFEDWSKKYFVIVSKRDSDVAGAKGNQERFYLLGKIK